MPERKKGDPKWITRDIQKSEIDAFKAKWDTIDPQKYTKEGLQRLTKNSQESLVYHLEQRSFAIGEKHSPNDGNKQTSIAGDYLLGAVFADEVMNTVHVFNRRVESDDLIKFHNYLDSFTNNPHDSLIHLLPALSPNLGDLMFKVIEGRELESKNYIATGFVEMYSIKLAKFLGKLPPAQMFPNRH